MNNRDGEDDQSIQGKELIALIIAQYWMLFPWVFVVVGGFFLLLWMVMRFWGLPT